MGKGQYSVSAKAVCPYYRSEQRTQKEAKIRCDGAAPGSWLHVVFDTRETMLSWRDRRCKACWEECPVARMLGKR